MAETTDASSTATLRLAIQASPSCRRDLGAALKRLGLADADADDGGGGGGEGVGAPGAAAAAAGGGGGGGGEGRGGVAFQPAPGDRPMASACHSRATCSISAKSANIFFKTNY